MTRKYFGTDGIRGRTNTAKLTPEVAMKAGMAAGRIFTRGEHRHRVVIGKDTRLSGYMIESALVSGFTAVGMDVFQFGPLPTPAVAMLTRSLRADMGVMITASHNPFEDNGIKFFGPDGQKLSDEVEMEIESLMDAGLEQGLAPSEGNPQFHQQFVYAVAMKTIRHFERALGRKIVWYPRLTRTRSARGQVQFRRDYVQQLRVYPHALRDANAYYDPDKTALLFGYFAAADQYYGRNYPGGLVFTCLSPDIVAHEMTHAILDSIHHRYIEDTNPDVAAFHEGFADIVALLQRFTFRALVEDRLYAAGGRMDQQAFVLGELATQFGEALRGNRGALRNMIGREDDEGHWRPLEPSPADYANAIEAHDRGAVLVATIFDAFQRIYAFRTRDLLRIATNGTGVLPKGNISRDLVGRLASEAAEIAEHLLHICIRALDYSPPNDITDRLSVPSIL